MQYLFSTLIAALLCFSLAAQPAGFDLPKNLEEKVDEFYAKWQTENHPGGAVAIVHQGKTVLAKGYGLASLEHQIPFTPETVSDIGSVAKQLTCFGMVLLAQQGKLQLDDDIRRYLPEVPDFGRPITIRHLMNHTSGLREIYATEALRGYRSGDGILQEDALQLVTHLRELNFPPGDRYSYCNTGYMLLAIIISRVTEQPFEAWMQTNVFQPLGMNHTHIMDHPGEVFHNAADSYQAADDNRFVEIYDNSTVQGAGGVYTSLTDLTTWFNHLREPKTGGQAAMDQMLQRGILNNGDTLNYALGLTVDTYRGLRRIQHTGSSAGYRALLSYFPDLDLGIIIKTNCPGFERQELVDRLLEPVLTPAPPAEEQAPTVTLEIPAATLNAYTGRYFSDELATAYTFTVEEGKLTGRHFRHGAFTLEATAADVFRTDAGFISEVRFIRNAGGEVTGLRASNGGVLDLWMGRMR